jgi:alkylation response protein AidB-like acyl-CoA dehydrogenase
MTAGSESTREEILENARGLAKAFAIRYPSRDMHREFPHEEISELKKSGLLAIGVPKEHGGLGLAFEDVVEVVMTIAEGNPSVAQMFGAVHCVQLQFIDDLCTDVQKKRIFGAVMQNKAFLGNAASERYSRHVLAHETTFVPKDNGMVVNGKKFFCTGSLASDIFAVAGMLNNEPSVAFVPKNAEGVVIHNDWNAMGQRGTASGTMEFKDVYVDSDMVAQFVSIQDPDPSNFFGPMIQIYFCAVFIGTAKAALSYALDYVKNKTRPWPYSGLDSAKDDPYILEEIGRMQAHLSAAESLVRHAAKAIAEGRKARATEDRSGMTVRRAEAAVVVSEAKLVSTEVALRVCQDVFQVCGARSAMAEENLDRFWRDVRTLTLHDPVAYKARLIGEYLVQGKPPFIGFYS